MRYSDKIKINFKSYPNRLFFWAAGLFFLGFWLVESVPVLNFFLMKYFKWDVLGLMNSSSLIGWRKIAAFRIAEYSFFGLTVLTALMTFRSDRHSIYRLLALGPIFLIYSVNAQWPNWVRYDRIFKSSVRHFYVEGYEEIFSRKNFDRPQIQTFEKLAKVLDKQFNRFRERLRNQWDIDNEQKLKALFLMNVVSNYWHFGNRENPEETGCVASNEQTGFRDTPESEITASLYLRSDVACCSDFAFLLKFLLDRSRIENRLAWIPGHVMNEVKFANGWRVLDASTGIMFSGSWQYLLEHPEFEPTFTIFPVAGIRKDGLNYSPAMGGLRNVVASLAVHETPIQPRYGYVLPEPFRSEVNQTSSRAN